MARYIINKNAKSKAEEKLIYQLGGPDMIEKYDRGRRIKKSAPKITKALAFPAIAAVIIGFTLIHNDIIALIGFGLILITIVYGLSAEIIISLKQKDAVRLSPDLKEMTDSFERDRLEINEYGVSHILLMRQGDEDSPEMYLKKYIEKENINEILRCDTLGLYVFCGNTETYIAYGDVLNKNSASVKWERSSYLNQASLRVYDFWNNEVTGADDIKTLIMTSFDSMSLRNVSTEEVMEIIKKDELLKINSSKFKLLK